MTSRRTLLALAAGIAAVAMIVGLWAFQPWKAFTSSTVDEALPSVGVSVTPPTGSTGASQPPAPAAPATPALLAEGGFLNQEHETSGVARLVELPDGSRVLRLEGFATSDGPDVHVWLTDQQAGGSDWNIYDDGWYVPLGKLKGTNGNQNYPVPPDANLAALRSVVIWCDRFNVSFGSAALQV